jgi:hypothetical protein
VSEDLIPVFAVGRTSRYAHVGGNIADYGLADDVASELAETDSYVN